MENPRSCWATPPNLFATFNDIYDYTLDAAASSENTKCPNFYSREDDAFTCQPTSEVIWLNPPYCGSKFGEKSLGAWCDLAIEWSNNNKVSLLLPCDTGTIWFKKLFILPCRRTFITPRVPFIPPTGITQSSNRGPSVLFTLGVDSLTEFYDWKKREFTECK
jgi:phage N-6-adenine-methyltransferase